MYMKYFRTTLLAVLTCASAQVAMAQVPTTTPVPSPVQITTDGAQTKTTAQTVPQDPCTTVSGAIDGATQDPNTSYGYWGEGSYYGEPKQDPKPKNPTSKVCAMGKVQVIVGITPTDTRGNPEAHRHFGHFIMDRIPITVVLSLDPSVVVDFTSLEKQRVVGFAGSEFELAKQAPGETPAVQITGPMVDSKSGRKVYKIDLIVQSMVYKPTIIFNLDLRYATDKLPDGSGYAWHTITTPDFVISRTNIADNGEELLEGDLSAKGMRLSWMTVTAFAAGTFLVLIFPGLWLVKWLSRQVPRPAPSPERVAWKSIESHYKSGKKDGFKRKNLKAMAHALRRYLATTADYPQLAALTFMEMEARFAEVETFPLVRQTLELLERDVFASVDLDDAEAVAATMDSATSLTAEELQKAFDGIEALVPRPWDSK